MLLKNFLLNFKNIKPKIRLNAAFSSVLEENNIFDSKVLESDSKMNVLGFGDRSFKVNDKLIGQSILLLPKSLYLWNAKQFSDITVDSLILFPLIYPTIEILFIGFNHN